MENGKKFWGQIWTEANIESNSSWRFADARMLPVCVYSYSIIALHRLYSILNTREFCRHLKLGCWRKNESGG